jgi:hypothetical protein
MAATKHARRPLANAADYVAVTTPDLATGPADGNPVFDRPLGDATHARKDLQTTAVRRSG